MSETLRRLVRDFMQGNPLPERVGGIPLLQWLDGLRHDQRECGFPDLAVALGVTTERPWIGETASTLKFRLEEQNGAA
jgi:hypothetical protein